MTTPTQDLSYAERNEYIEICEMENEDRFKVCQEFDEMIIELQTGDKTYHGYPIKAELPEK